MLSLPYGDIDSLRRNTSWSLVVRDPRRQRPARGSIERRFGFSRCESSCSSNLLYGAPILTVEHDLEGRALSELNFHRISCIPGTNHLYCRHS